MADTKPPQPGAAPQTRAPTIPDSYWPMLARIESSNNPNAKAASSSASGLYQFTRSTWLGEGGLWGSDSTKPFGGLHPTPSEQTERARTFTEKNAAYLASAGLPITCATLYAAHFFGPAVAARVLCAAPDARADALAGSAATAANPSILARKTVAQFRAWLIGRTGVVA